ncbi:MFS transporter [Agrobacterium sp. Ap1]|uniref:MFS transporter n=1 Tax=Agrobacterium sp. Ap1 TaxID=2815337 RepID=UPI001A8EF7CB|nr:MFS transporter [Agrobacterium sp. Ap1]MBO0144518.1 MFS transporter [Agrobacterium sp. Ap1]
MSRRVLGQRASFYTAAAVVAHTIWTSAAPVLTYPLYAQEWHLSTFTTTAIFAVYPVFVVATLVLFGNLSDFIGRREAMLLGLSGSAIGSLLFTFAPDVTGVLVGRAFMGIGVGLSAGPSAAAVVEFSPAGKAGAAGATTAAAQAIGMMVAALVGGALIEYAPLPTRLNFAVLTIVLLAMIYATWRLPNFTVRHATGRWRPAKPSIPAGMLLTFLTATVAVTTSYVLGAMTLSLGAQVAKDVIASSNALVNGGTIAVFAAAIFLATMVARKMSYVWVLRLSVILSFVSVASLALASQEQSLVLYILSQLAGGAAYSLLLLGGLSLITEEAPVTHRGATLSALFLVAYLAQAVLALSLGKIATGIGLHVAIDTGIAVIAVLAVLTLLFVELRRRIDLSASRRNHA